jgi:Ni,Fe-hydrogenase III small subunit
MKLTKYQPSIFNLKEWLAWRILGKAHPPEWKGMDKRERPSTQRSIFLRHLDCGSCNGCELALHALNNPFYDLPGHGIHFVASPRHADMLVITGPLTHNMQEAALTTLNQLPTPRALLVGDCAIDGGPFRHAYGVINPEERPAELRTFSNQVPGCPPDPQIILEKLISTDLSIPMTPGAKAVQTLNRNGPEPG